MTDLVVTCPKHFWAEWIDEGDPAGEPYQGGEWAWYTGRCNATMQYKPPIEPGERLYIVAHGRLRGYAPVVRVEEINGRWAIIRRGGAEAVTLKEGIRGFQGWRLRWWEREDEIPFPDWKTEGVYGPRKPYAEDAA